MSTGKGGVVVTGASTGIGRATVERLIRAGFTVYGSVRKKADADALQAACGERFVPLLFDVTDAQAVQEAATDLRATLNGQTLSGLVNNAGIAIGGPLLHLPIKEFRHQFEVNLTGVLITTQGFAPLLGAEPDHTGPKGRIVNIGSVAGRHAFPFMGPYHTTKFGLEGFTDSLRRELMPFGVDAILVAPGSVDTPIWDKADQKDYAHFEATAYAPALARFRKAMLASGRGGLPPERIAETVFEALTVKSPKPYYRVTNAPLTFHALSKLPKRLVDRVIARQLGLKPGRH